MPIKQQDQRIVGATEAEDEEQYVEHTPQHEANQHGFTWGNDFRHHAGDPRRQGGSQTVESKGKGSLRRGESECFDVVRQKSQLKPSPVINTAMATYPQMRLSGRPYHCLLLTDMLTSISECR